MDYVILFTDRSILCTKENVISKLLEVIDAKFLTNDFIEDFLLSNVTNRIFKLYYWVQYSHGYVAICDKDRCICDLKAVLIDNYYLNINAVENMLSNIVSDRYIYFIQFPVMINDIMEICRGFISETEHSAILTYLNNNVSKGPIISIGNIQIDKHAFCNAFYNTFPVNIADEKKRLSNFTTYIVSIRKIVNYLVDSSNL